MALLRDTIFVVSGRSPFTVFARYEERGAKRVAQFLYKVNIQRQRTYSDVRGKSKQGGLRMYRVQGGNLLILKPNQVKSIAAKPKLFLDDEKHYWQF